LFTISLLHFSLANETPTKQGTRSTQFLASARWAALSESGRHHPAFGCPDFNAPELPAVREAR